MIYLNIPHTSDWWNDTDIPCKNILIEFMYKSVIIRIDENITLVAQENGKFTRLTFSNKEDRTEFILKYM